MKISIAQTLKKPATKLCLAVLVIMVMVVGPSHVSQALTVAQITSGYILLQVEKNGEAWYVYPKTLTRFSLDRPADSFSIMRRLGVGITNANLAKIPIAGSTATGDTTLRKKMSGYILLQIEKNGEAWYVYPKDTHRYSLGRPADAFSIMRKLGLGTTNANLVKIPYDPVSYRFTNLPFKIANVGAVSPLGGIGQVTRSQTGSGHPYGDERHFIWHKEPLGRALYNVYAPGEGTFSAFKLTNAPPYGRQYQLYFRIDNNRLYYLAHINELESTLEAKIRKSLGGTISESNNPIPMDNSIAVLAGDLLGKTGATNVNWDWGLADNTYSKGITYPDHYTGLGAGHARSVYDLATVGVKAQLRQLSGLWNSTDQSFTTRIGDPPLGILGSDVKGTLSGIWFQSYEFNPYPHVALFSPYSLDASKLQILLEIPDLDLFGGYQNSSRSDEIEALDGVSLRPADIIPSSGIVGYYLHNGTEDGVLMIRVNTNETITLEAIRGIQTMPDTFAFSNRAITLKR